MNTIEREENCGRGAYDLGMSSHDFVCVLAQTSASVNSSISRVLVVVLPPPAGVVVTSSRFAQHWLLGYIEGGSCAELFGL